MVYFKTYYSKWLKPNYYLQLFAPDQHWVHILAPAPNELDISVIYDHLVIFLSLHFGARTSKNMIWSILAITNTYMTEYVMHTMYAPSKEWRHSLELQRQPKTSVPQFVLFSLYVFVYLEKTVHIIEHAVLLLCVNVPDLTINYFHL